MAVAPQIPYPLQEASLPLLVFHQITHRLLYTLEINEQKAQQPLVFLDMGYGDPEFLQAIFSCLPLASYVFCQAPEEFQVKKQKDLTDFFHHIIWDKASLPFSASFDMILVSWRSFLEAPAELIVRSLIACLKPGGRLYLVGLGECSFYEWFYTCQHMDLPLSFPSFLHQRHPLWPEDSRGVLQEEWLHLFCPTLDALLNLFDSFQKKLVDYIPFPRATLEKAFERFQQESKGYLTLHLFYGCYTKPEDIREE